MASEISHTTLIAGLLAIAIFVSALGVLSLETRFSVSGLVSGTTTGTVASSTTITLPTSTVAFSSVSVGANYNTTDDSPAPFVVQNDGSVNLNVTINASALWSGASAAATDYQFMCGDSSEATCPAGSQTDWTNLNVTAQLIMANLNYSNAADTLQAEININVPSDEPTGAKESTVEFTSSAA